MKKQRIIGMVLATIMIMLVCCGFATSTSNEKIPEVETYTVESLAVETENIIVETSYVEEEFEVEKLTEFEDEDILTYDIATLDLLIAEQEQIKINAHELAKNARSLGWPEDSDTIQFAKSEYHNANLAIQYYNNRKQELIAEKEKELWEIKKSEYPVATEIWLYMKDLGWSDYVCAGILGNIMAEVGGQTLNIQYQISGNGYYGMCQWNQAYCSKVWGADLQGQCDFLRDSIKYEIDTFGYAYTKGFDFDSFLELTSERDVAKAFAKCYERCSSASYWIRQENATVAYNYFVTD